MKRIAPYLIVALALLLALPAAASPTAGTISSPAYAWGEKLGWIVFDPDQGGLLVSDTALIGYVWSRQFGWINFSPSASGQGVTNDGEGHLQGSAWIANRGWLDMSGVTIGSDGHFSGVAGTADSSAGRVSFDCAACSVTTDWRPVSVRQAANGGGGGVGGGGGLPGPQTPPGPIGPEPPETPPEPEPEPLPETPPPTTPTISPDPGQPGSGGAPKPRTPVPTGISADNGPLVIGPDQSGTLTRNLGKGTRARLDVIKGIAKEQVKLDIKPVPIDLHGYNPRFRPLGRFFFEVKAHDSKDRPLASLGEKIKVTLPLGGGETPRPGDEIGVYSFDAFSRSWQRIEPAAINGQSAVFYTSQATRYAILSGRDLPATIKPSPSPWQQLPPLAITAVVLFGFLALSRAFKATRLLLGHRS